MKFIHKYANRKISFLFSLVLLTFCMQACTSSVGMRFDVGNLLPKYEDKYAAFIYAEGLLEDDSYYAPIWEGMQKNSRVKSMYYKLQDNSNYTFLATVKNFYAQNYRALFLPDYATYASLEEAQKQFPDMLFIAFDAMTARKKGENLPPNAISVDFSEEEAGFLAGFAAALEKKGSTFGFIGGVENLDALNQYYYGFAQGIKYASDHYNARGRFVVGNIQYVGDFVDTAKAQRLAKNMYDNGVDIILAAAGKASEGVFMEAKRRAQARIDYDEVWVIGTDIDQFDLGIYDQENKRSVTLTSALLNLEQASNELSTQFAKNELVGGKLITYNIKNDGIGLPTTNPNLSLRVTKELEKIYTRMKTGSITVEKKK